jgi:hypothetical protein
MNGRELLTNFPRPGPKTQAESESHNCEAKQRHAFMPLGQTWFSCDSEDYACFIFGMTGEKTDPAHDLEALANEACDLWQEHLASYAADPKTRSELMRLLEPSRRLFAEWAVLMQHGPHAEFFGKSGTGPSLAKSGPSGGAVPPRPAAARAASDGGVVPVARLADIVAGFEKRLARIEHGSAKSPRASAHAPRTRTKS